MLRTPGTQEVFDKKNYLMNQFIFSLINLFSEHLWHIYMVSHEPGIEINELQGTLSAVRKVLASTMRSIKNRASGSAFDK